MTVAAAINSIYEKITWKFSKLPGFLIILCTLSGCQLTQAKFEPAIVYTPNTQLTTSNSSAFPPMSQAERRQDWGKEVIMGDAFACELDLYRALTCYKRAEILIPPKFSERQLQIQYNILQSYYIGGKYQDVIDTFEKGPLYFVLPSFSAFDDLIIMLYDAYQKIEQQEKADSFLQLIESRKPEIAQHIRLSNALLHADFCALDEEKELECFLTNYHSQTLSIRRAQVLNAILPGAGYLYVGQKQTALTSFVINTLFTAAAYHFFAHGNIGAGLIISSLEAGWYLGGINGAGLAAKEFNERIYNSSVRELMVQRRLFPVLMLQYTF